MSSQHKTARDAAKRAERERLALQKRVQELERRINELEADLQLERSTCEDLRSQAEQERARAQASGPASTSSSASNLKTESELKSTASGKANGVRGAPSPQRQTLGSAPPPPHFAEFVEMKRRLKQALEENAQLRASLQMAQPKQWVSSFYCPLDKKLIILTEYLFSSFLYW